MTLYTFFTTPVNDRHILEPAYKNLLAVCENVDIVQAGETFTMMGQCYGVTTIQSCIELSVTFYAFNSFMPHHDTVLIDIRPISSH